MLIIINFVCTAGLQSYHHTEQKLHSHIATLTKKLAKTEKTLTELQQQLSQKEETLSKREKELNYFTQEQLIGKILG